jgi:hypothetical protein
LVDAIRIATEEERKERQKGEKDRERRGQKG